MDCAKFCQATSPVAAARSGTLSSAPCRDCETDRYLNDWETHSASKLRPMSLSPNRSHALLPPLTVAWNMLHIGVAEVCIGMTM
jgi:hypothetical protein